MVSSPILINGKGESMDNKFELEMEQLAHAENLHQEAIIVDALAGHIVAPEPPPIDGKLYLDRLIEAGVTAANITLAAHADSFETLLKKMYAYFNLLEARPDKTLLVETVADIHQAKQEGKVGIFFTQQTGTPVGRDISKWTILWKLGLRISQLTYMERSVFGDGCYEPENRGLTAYGRQAVQEMNRLGIVLDLSHAGERTSLEAIEYSQKPPIFSHANPREVGPSRRNITDEQIRAAAAKGGVVGITPHSELCHKIPGVRPTIDDFLDHIDYVVALVGVDHVGIGSDIYESYTKVSWESQTKRMYPGPWVYETMLSEGFSRITDLPKVTAGLIKRGYDDLSIKKILGDNWLRVFSQTWR
jgi:membrane dipeptidase